MKKLYLYLTRSEDRAVSLPLLMVAFIAGWMLATGLFYVWGHGVPAAIQGLFRKS